MIYLRFTIDLIVLFQLKQIFNSPYQNFFNHDNTIWIFNCCSQPGFSDHLKAFERRRRGEANLEVSHKSQVKPDWSSNWSRLYAAELSIFLCRQGV